MPQFRKGGLMKSLRIAALSSLLVLCSALAHAGPIDPGVHVGGGDGSVAITSPNFSIFSSTGTSPPSDCFLNQDETSTDAPNCSFSNGITEDDTGLAITQLVFDVSDADLSGTSGTLMCDEMTGFGMGPFTACSIASVGSFTVTFSSGSIQPGDHFTFAFDGFNPTGATFDATATTGPASTVPEPGTLALLLGAMGTFLVARRFRRV